MALNFNLLRWVRATRWKSAWRQVFREVMSQGNFSESHGKYKLQVEKPERGKGIISNGCSILTLWAHKVARGCSFQWTGSTPVPFLQFLSPAWIKKPRWNEKVLLATGYGHLQVKKKRGEFQHSLKHSVFSRAAQKN